MIGGSVARHSGCHKSKPRTGRFDHTSGGQVQKMFSNISIFKTKSSLARVASVEVTQIPRVRSPTEPTSFCSSYGSAQSTIWFLLRRRRVGLFRANSSPPRSGCGCSEGRMNVYIYRWIGAGCCVRGNTIPPCRWCPILLTCFCRTALLCRHAAQAAMLLNVAGSRLWLF